MKKTKIFAMAVLLTSLSPLLYSKDNPSIELTKKVGNVQTNIGQSWESAAPNIQLPKGSSIKTGLDSYAELALNPENRFRVKEQSEVKMDKILEGISDPVDGVVKLVQFNLKSGSMLAKLDNLPKGVKLSVGSPTAVAGATGTEFAVAVETNGQTHVAVLESNVTISSTSNPNQSVVAGHFQKVDIAPWDVVRLQAKGTGLPSKKILGENFIRQGESTIQLIGVGSGTTPQEAHIQARRILNDRILDIEIGAEKKLDDLFEQEFELSQKVLQLIYQAAPRRKEQLANNLFEEELELSLAQLSETLGFPLPSVQQTIRPISLEEYGQKFGPLARVTTRRAAQVDALRKLAEKIYGAVVDSKTTVRNFEATNDKITTVVQGVVQGSEIIHETYFSDGSISVEVEAPGLNIKGALTQVMGDLLGTNYLSSPTRIIVDDFDAYKELENI